MKLKAKPHKLDIWEITGRLRLKRRHVVISTRPHFTLEREATDHVYSCPRLDVDALRDAGNAGDRRAEGKDRWAEGNWGRLPDVRVGIYDGQWQ